MKKILLYSRSTTIRETVRIYLKKDYFVLPLDDTRKLVTLISRHEFDLVIAGTQKDCPPEEMTMLDELNTRYPATPVFVIVPGTDDLDYMIRKYPDIRDGITLPFDSASLKTGISRVLETTPSDATDRSVQMPCVMFYGPDGNPVFDIRILLNNLPRGGAHIHLVGEKGTRTGLIPRFHHIMLNKNTSFVSLPCHVMKENEIRTALDSMNFSIQPIQTGTVFFQHVDRATPHVQELLLDWIYATDHDIRSTAPDQAPGIFFSSGPELHGNLESGGFNRELFYHMSEFALELPSINDLGNLKESVFKELVRIHAEQIGVPVLDLTDETSEFINLYSWPWNLVEMEWVIRRMLGEKPPRQYTLHELASLTAHFHLDNLVESTPPEMVYPQTPASDSAPLYTSQRVSDSVITNQPGWNHYKIDSLLLEIVHNVKNPLVAIKTFAELLPDKYDDDDFKEKFYKIVLDDINRIDSFLSEITFHINLGDADLHQFNLNKLVKETTANLQQISKTNNISIDIAIQNGVQSIEQFQSDPNMLEYVINNIIYQGISDLDPGGHIRITFEGNKPGQPGDSAKMIFELQGTRERKDSFAFLNLSPPDTIINLKLLLAERVLQKLNGWLEQSIETDESMKILLHLKQ